jgi:hypothetical protein
MHRIKIFTESETTFVKEHTFALPAFDGDAEFCLDQAMAAIGGLKLGPNEWNINLNVIEIADYLSQLSRSENDPTTLRCQWVRKHLLKGIIDTLPFQGKDVDWDSVSSIVESRVAQEFPLCS